MPAVALAIVVLLNGQMIQFQDAQPIKDEGRVLVPLRGVFEAMGAKVDYRPLTRTVEIRQKERAVELSIGRNHAWVDGDPVTLDSSMRVENGRVLVPIRFVAEALGANVGWNGARNAVLIETSEPGIMKGRGPQIPQQTPTNGRPSMRSPLQVVATTGKATYSATESVQFTIKARNTSDAPYELNFSSGQSFDITVTPANTKTPRWDWSHDKAFTMALRSQTLAPGEELTFKATWNQRDNEENFLPRGNYTAHATLTIMNGGITAPPIHFTLTD